VHEHATHTDADRTLDVGREAVTDHHRLRRSYIEQLQTRLEDARMRLHVAVLG
jgi:hypothetical protein